MTAFRFVPSSSIQSPSRRTRKMLKRTSLILTLLLGASATLLAQSGGNGNGQGNAERLTGLERAAQRHALKGERALAEGRRLLRHATLGAKPELSRRQQAAETSY